MAKQDCSRLGLRLRNLPGYSFTLCLGLINMENWSGVSWAWGQVPFVTNAQSRPAHLRPGHRSNCASIRSVLQQYLHSNSLGAYFPRPGAHFFPMPLPHSPLSWQSMSLCPQPLPRVSCFLADHGLSGVLSITPCLTPSTDKALLQNGYARVIRDTTRWYRIMPPIQRMLFSYLPQGNVS